MIFNYKRAPSNKRAIELTNNRATRYPGRFPVNTYPEPVLDDGDGFVHDERQAEHAHVILQIVADA